MWPVSSARSSSTAASFHCDNSLYLSNVFVFFLRRMPSFSGGKYNPSCTVKYMLEKHTPYRLLLIGVVRCPFLLFYPCLKLLRFF